MKKNMFTANQKKNIKAAFVNIDRDKLASLLLKREKASRNIVDQIAAGLSKVSAERAVLIEKITNGKINRSVLRPDIFEDLKKRA